VILYPSPPLPAHGDVPRRAEQGEEWQAHYVFFARAGFTDAARAEAGVVGAQLVDLETLDTDLRRAQIEG